MNKNTCKILLIGHDASLSGAPRSFLNIASILVELGFKVEFILASDGPLLNEYESMGKVMLWNKRTVENIALRVLYKFAGKPLSTRNKSKIFEYVRENPPNLIINNTVVNGSIVEKLKSLKIPIVSRIAELEGVIQIYNTNGESSKVLHNSDYFVAVSDAVKNNLIHTHRIDKDRISVIYGYVKSIDTGFHKSNRATIRKSLGIPEDAFVVLNTNNLLYHKGFDLFVLLADMFAKRGIADFYFIWVGGDLSSQLHIGLRQDLSKRKINNVRFIGHQSNVMDFYAASDAFFLSSREDPFPISMLEAAQFGLPIIGFEQSGGVEEFIKKDGGFLVEYANITEVFDALIKLQDKHTYNSYSHQSFNNFKSFSRERAVKAWSLFLKDILNNVYDEHQDLTPKNR